MAEYSVTKYQLFNCRRLFRIVIKTALLFFLFPLFSFTDAQWFWQYPPHTYNLYDVNFISENTGWAVGILGTIIKTTDGGTTWTTQTSGTNSILKGVSFTDENTGTVVGEYGTILRTTNGGINWISQSYPIYSHWHAVFFVDANTGTIVGSNGIILRTTNAGVNWNLQTSNTMNSLYRVCFTDANTGTVVGASGIILRTTNGGITWNPQSSGSSSFLYGVSFINANIGTIVGSGKILRTTNGGATWTSQLNVPSPHFYGVCSTDENTCTAVGTNGTILRTTNGGETWSPQTPDSTITLNAVCFTDANTGIAVGGGGAILRTTNGGVPVELTSFNALSENNLVTLSWSTATELNNRGFEIERKNNNAWRTLAFVSGHGTTSEIQNYSYTDNLSDLDNTSIVTYRLKQVDYDGSFEYSKEIEVALSLVSDYGLAQNYPNPFNPSTTISYSIPAHGKVRLIVYDALGREVSKLVDEQKDAGNYEIKFNADGLASGMYFYRLSAGERVISRMMILLK